MLLRKQLRKLLMIKIDRMKVSRIFIKFSEKIFRFHDNNLKQRYLIQTLYVLTYLIRLSLHLKIRL